MQEWFAALPTYSATGGLPARGSIAAALVILERLKKNYQLGLDAHRASGKAQIRGLTSSALKKILASFGECRPFLSEGGRTNRGAPGDVENMLNILRPLELDRESTEARQEVLAECQRFLVEKVRDYHSRKRLEIVYDPARTTWMTVKELLRQAEAVGKAGPVAQYLVGAKLQIRFPNIRVSNERYSAADVQTQRLGDFEVGDTVFHVTVAPGADIYEKCRHNVEQGLCVYLLVPDDFVVGARQNAEAAAPGQIAVASLESFIANNIEELSAFQRDQRISGFRCLLETYNRRVEEIELDKSMLIEIPRTLA